MRLEKQVVAAGFRQIVELLEMHGADPGELDVFRSLAETLPADTAREDSETGGVAEPSSAARFAAGIIRYLDSGELPELEDVAATVHPALAALLRTQAPATYPQFRPLFASVQPPHRLQRALPLAERVATQLAGCSGINDTALAGDCRRARAAVSRIEIVASSHAPRAALQEASEIPVFANGGRVNEDALTLIAQDELPVTVRFTSTDAHGAALARYTGSAAHCAAVERLAATANLRFTTQGIEHHGRQIPTPRESDVYALLGMDWMEPELREDRGEIEAARTGQLPKLVDDAAICGDLHCRPGGHAAFADLAQAAEARGWQYLAVTLPAADRDTARAWLDMVDRFHAQRETPCLLKSAECAILEDGSLDLPADILTRLDLTICNVRSNPGLGQRRQTERIIRAMDHPAFMILAAPAGSKEKPYRAVDMERILRAASARGCLLEIENSPLRPQVQELHVQMARDIGVCMALGSGAARADQLGNLRFGLLQARRGWLEPGHIVNTLPLEKLRERLRR